MSEAAEEKKPQGQKPGKVLRIDRETWNFIKRERRTGERLSDCVRRVVGLTPKGEELQTPESKFTLPSFLFNSKEEAKGEALYRAVKEKVQPEPPVEVKKVP